MEFTQNACRMRLYWCDWDNNMMCPDKAEQLNKKNSFIRGVAPLPAPESLVFNTSHLNLMPPPDSCQLGC